MGNETATHLQEQLQKAGCQYEIKKTQEESTTQAESSTQQENSTTQAESSTQIVVGDSTSASVLKKGDTFVVGNLKYKVISAKNAAFIGLKNKKIKHLMIPEQVKVGAQTFTITQIQKKACYHNKTLKMIVVGDCVVTMKEAAFAGCTKLKRIYLGTSIKTIGKKAFAKDKKIKKIVIKGKKLKSIGKNAFLDIPKSIDIRVPKSKIEAYEKMINRK